MYQIDSSGSVASQPSAAAAGVAGWFTGGNPAIGQQATILDSDWFNAVQAELINVIESVGITPTKGTNNQLLAAILALVTQKTTGKADHVKSNGTPVSGSSSTFTNTLHFTAPSDGFVYAIHSVNIGSINGSQPGNQSNTVTISGSSSGNASDSDNTASPMVNHVTKAVVAGETVTVTGVVVSGGATGSWSNNGMSLSYTFTPSV